MGLWEVGFGWRLSSSAEAAVRPDSLRGCFAVVR